MEWREFNNFRNIDTVRVLYLYWYLFHLLFTYLSIDRHESHFYWYHEDQDRYLNSNTSPPSFFVCFDVIISTVHYNINQIKAFSFVLLFFFWWLSLLPSFFLFPFLFNPNFLRWLIYFLNIIFYIVWWQITTKNIGTQAGFKKIEEDE